MRASVARPPALGSADPPPATASTRFVLAGRVGLADTNGEAIALGFGTCVGGGVALASAVGLGVIAGVAAAGDALDTGTAVGVVPV